MKVLGLIFKMYRSLENFHLKYFIDENFQGKIFSWIHDFLKIFYLEHTLPAIKTINSYSYSIPYVILFILPFMQGEVQSGYSKRAYSYQSEIINACMEIT